MTTTPPKKSLYEFDIVMPVPLSFSVRATSLEKAVKAATAGYVPQLCHECREQVPNEWCLGDFDVDPERAELDAARCAPNQGAESEDILEEARKLWPAPSAAPAPAPPPPPAWQPMDSAPKDGTLIVICLVLPDRSFGSPMFAWWDGGVCAWFVDGDPSPFPEGLARNWLWTSAPVPSTGPVSRAT